VRATNSVICQIWSKLKEEEEEEEARKYCYENNNLLILLKKEKHGTGIAHIVDLSPSL